MNRILIILTLNDISFHYKYNICEWDIIDVIFAFMIYIPFFCVYLYINFMQIDFFSI